MIPARDERGRLPDTLDRLLDGSLRLGAELCEVIVADDGSTDGTDALVADRRRSDPRVRLVRAGGGKGHALRTGFGAAVGDRVVFLDADLPVHPDDVVRLADGLDGADVVAASRCRDRGGSADLPTVRRLGSSAFRTALAAMGLRPTSDPQCGAKALDRARMGAVVDRCREDGFAFDVELLCLARRSERNIAEVGVRWHHQEGSRVRPLRDATRTLGRLLRRREELR